MTVPPGVAGQPRGLGSSDHPTDGAVTLSVKSSVRPDLPSSPAQLP